LLPWDELRTFHRRELMRQRDLGFRVFIYWNVPAVFLILCALTTAVPQFRGGVTLLVAIGMQNCVVAWAHRKERHRMQNELDRMERKVEEPV
jgi:hypothetical protein